MAKPTTTERPGGRAPAAPGAGPAGRPGWVVPAGLFAVVVALFVLAAVFTGTVGGGGGGQGRAEAGLEAIRPVAVAGSPLPTHDVTDDDPAVGMTAPVLTGASFDGRPVEIGRPGRPTLILFVAHWCPHCRREIPLLAPQLSRITPPGADVVTVSTSVRESGPNYPPATWLADERWPVPVLADDAAGQAAQAYGLSGFPYYVLLDRTGAVVGRDSGEKTVAEVEAMLQRITT